MLSLLWGFPPPYGGLVVPPAQVQWECHASTGTFGSPPPNAGGNGWVVVVQAGVQPAAEESATTLVNIAQLDRPEQPVKGPPRVTAQPVGPDAEAVYRSPGKGVRVAKPLGGPMRPGHMRGRSRVPVQ